jgi:hypothetical protein
MTATKILTCAAALIVAAAGSGCNSLDAPDQNAVSLDGLTSAPTSASVSAATQDLLVGMRADASSITSGYGQFGREAYNLDPGNLQNVQQYFIVLGDVAIWSGPYRTIKVADLVLQAVDEVPSYTAAQKEGFRGFAMTVKALELMTVIRTLDQSGAALDAASSATSALPPIESKADVYTDIRQLLDSAQTHLAAAGSTFSFNLGAGFASFNTPPKFLQFNRAIRARADIDVGDFTSALTDLSASFISTAQPFFYGPFNTYSNAAGDVQNPLYEAQPRVWYANPVLATNVQLKADGTPDNRFITKVKQIPAITRAGVTTQWTFQNYAGSTAPIYIVRNEELILLRAEANVGLGNTSAAISDINFIRTNSGGLAPISDPYVPAAGQPATLLDELLYEKRYSLMWEEGTSSWLDARHYGELAQLPHDQPAGSVVYPYTRIPDTECQARSNTPAGCQMPPKF